MVSQIVNIHVLKLEPIPLTYGTSIQDPIVESLEKVKIKFSYPKVNKVVGYHNFGVWDYQNTMI